MKNQYFADIRDLFKYDLVLEFLLQSGLKRFTFIPMLTKDEPDYRGGRTDYSKARAGTDRKELAEHLMACIKEGRRDIGELGRVMRSSAPTAGIDLTIYAKDLVFTHEARRRYFDRIDHGLLERSIILVDPDVGLEVKSMGGREERYVAYNEIKLLYDRMDGRSVLIVFQFIPRVRRIPYISRLRTRLARHVARDGGVCYVSDNQVVLLALAKGSRSKHLARNVIIGYAKRYGLLSGPNEGDE